MLFSFVSGGVMPRKPRTKPADVFTEEDVAHYSITVLVPYCTEPACTFFAKDDTVAWNIAQALLYRVFPSAEVTWTLNVTLDNTEIAVVTGLMQPKDVAQCRTVWYEHTHIPVPQQMELRPLRHH